MSKQPDNAPDVATVFPKLIGALEAQLELPRGILLSLLEQSDWELVIKASVVAEVALGEAIQRALTSADREQITEKINQGLGPKIKVAKRFALLSREQCDYLWELSTMRNACVHDRKGLSFTFSSYLRDRANLASFRRRLGTLKSHPGHSAPELPETFLTPAAAVMARVSQVCLALLMKPTRTRTH